MRELKIANGSAVKIINDNHTPTQLECYWYNKPLCFSSTRSEHARVSEHAFQSDSPLAAHPLSSSQSQQHLNNQTLSSTHHTILCYLLR